MVQGKTSRTGMEEDVYYDTADLSSSTRSWVLGGLAIYQSVSFRTLPTDRYRRNVAAQISLAPGLSVEPRPYQWPREFAFQRFHN